MNVPLRAKLGLTLFSSVAAFLCTNHVLRRMSFRATFEEIEEGRAAVKLMEAERAIDGLSRELVAEARTLAPSEGASPTDVLPTQGDVVLVLDGSGHVLRLEAFDPDSKEPLRIRELPEERLSGSHPLALAWGQSSVPEGILPTARGYLVVGSHESGRGPERRLTVVGRFLTEERLALLDGAAEGALTVVPMMPRNDDPKGSPPFAVQDRLMGGEVVCTQMDGGQSVAFGAFPDLRGLPVMALRVDLGEPVWSRLERYELLTAVAVAIIFPLVLLVLLQFLVTGPLARLTSLATEIAASDDPTLRVRMKRRDEIGKLSHKFDSMLDEIERSRIHQARTARVVGRSEIAVGVMHNVGNLVNSVSVSANLARDGASALRVEDLKLILSALQDHRGELDEYLESDPQGAHLLEFFDALVAQLEATAGQTLRETDAVLERVGEITEMVHSLSDEMSAQESVESLKVDREMDELLDRVLVVGAASTGQTLMVERRLDACVEGRVDRHRVHEVMTALLMNAADAAPGAPSGVPRVLVTTEALAAGAVAVSVSDSGPGVPEAHRDEMFTMGFTTKEGRSGLGLHLASLSALEMGAKITAGRCPELGGAIFRFEFELDGARAL